MIKTKGRALSGKEQVSKVNFPAFLNDILFLERIISTQRAQTSAKVIGSLTHGSFFFNQMKNKDGSKK